MPTTEKAKPKSAPKKASPTSTKAEAPAQRKGTATRKAVKKGGKSSLSDQQRRCYVEVAAYYIAERRGFTGGSEVEDWVQAEAEIDRLIAEGILKP